MRPRPWHDEARRLRAEGLSMEKIGRKLDISHSRVLCLFNAEYAERQRLAKADYNRRRSADPAYREQRRLYFKRVYLRKCARKEAAETGVPIEQVYERWGVA